MHDVLIVFGVFTLILGIILLAIYLVKTRKLKSSAIVTGVGLAALVVGMAIAPGGTACTPTQFQDVARLLVRQVSIPEGSRVYGLRNPFPAQTDLNIQPDVGEPIAFRTKVPTYFFLIDDAPLMRFAHPVRYVLLEARGQAQVYPHEWLPIVNGQDWEIHEQIKVEGIPVTVLRESPRVRRSTSSGGITTAQGSQTIGTLPQAFLTFAREHLFPLKLTYAQSQHKKIALIVDGNENLRKYREPVAKQFAKETDDIASVLDREGYDTSRRYSGYKGNKLPSPQPSDLKEEISIMAGEAAPGDELLIYLNGHGNPNGFAMWTKEGYRSFLYYEQLADWLDQVDHRVKVVVIIDACYSGGALRHLGFRSNTVIATAASDKNTTPIGIGTRTDFSEHIVSAYRGKAADENKDGKVDIDEAVQYARKQHRNIGAVVRLLPPPPPTPTLTENITYTLSTSVSPPGSGVVVSVSVSPPSERGYAAGTQVTLTATPASGYRFVSWSGAISSTANPVTITMDSNKSVTANFEVVTTPPDLTVTSVRFSPGSGKAGDKITVTFTVKNQGGSPSGPFKNRISLAKTKWGTDISLGNPDMESIDPNTTRDGKVTVSVPDPEKAPEGSYWVTVFTDGFQKIDESDEYNNIGSSDTTLTVTATYPFDGMYEGTYRVNWYELAPGITGPPAMAGTMNFRVSQNKVIVEGGEATPIDALRTARLKFYGELAGWYGDWDWELRFFPDSKTGEVTVEGAWTLIGPMIGGVPCYKASGSYTARRLSR